MELKSIKRNLQGYVMSKAFYDKDNNVLFNYEHPIFEVGSYGWCLQNARTLEGRKVKNRSNGKELLIFDSWYNNYRYNIKTNLDISSMVKSMAKELASSRQNKVNAKLNVVKYNVQTPCNRMDSSNTSRRIMTYEEILDEIDNIIEGNFYDVRNVTIDDTIVLPEVKFIEVGKKPKKVKLVTVEEPISDEQQLLDNMDKESILDKPSWTLIKKYKPSEAEAKAHAKAKPFKALDSVGYINPKLSKFINKMVAYGVKATSKKDEHFVERKSNNTLMEHCSNDVLIYLRLNNN